jgi:hypothetical protein
VSTRQNRPEYLYFSPIRLSLIGIAAVLAVGAIACFAMVKIWPATGIFARHPWGTSFADVEPERADAVQESLVTPARAPSFDATEPAVTPTRSTSSNGMEATIWHGGYHRSPRADHCRSGHAGCQAYKCRLACREQVTPTTGYGAFSAEWLLLGGVWQSRCVVVVVTALLICGSGPAARSRSCARRLGPPFNHAISPGLWLLSYPVDVKPIASTFPDVPHECAMAMSIAELTHL